MNVQGSSKKRRNEKLKTENDKIVKFAVLYSDDKDFKLIN